MIHVAGIDSAGLAGAPAIELEVVQLLKQAGIQLERNPNFLKDRAPKRRGRKRAESLSSDSLKCTTAHLCTTVPLLTYARRFPGSLRSTSLLHLYEEKECVRDTLRVIPMLSVDTVLTLI